MKKHKKSTKHSKSAPSSLPAGTAYQQLVAAVVKAFDKGAVVTPAVWVQGPDGRRDMDVSIEGFLDEKPYRGVIECKDFVLKTSGKVGIAYVDALDSKRHDIGVDFALICSNSGFSEDAMKKARRKGIGLISVLAQGDSRVKVVIEQLIYFRKVCLGSISCTYYPSDPSQLAKIPNIQSGDITHQGKLVERWLYQKAVQYATNNPTCSDQMRATFKLLAPCQFDVRGDVVELHTIEATFQPQTRCFSQVVTLDAKMAMYDYLRGRMKFAPGENTYTINGLDFDKGTPVDCVEDLFKFQPVMPGEMDFQFTMLEQVPPLYDDSVADLDHLVCPADLEGFSPFALTKRE